MKRLGLCLGCDVMNCCDCRSWFGDIRPEYSYTGCEIGLSNLELSYFYLEDKLVKRKTGLSGPGIKCAFFKPIQEG